MSPLFGSFGLVPFFSVPPFGFCCCWPSMARSAKYLHTTQKQFRRMRNLDDETDDGTDGWKGRPSTDKTKSII
ncbi:unnamed protein product [Sphagnum troendelagicum]|uniref:Secreted protein n=1 Tax=Sphagnum troendelagicum TaxID=128251 RepID=A0ABP0V737_9BRYO